MAEINWRDGSSLVIASFLIQLIQIVQPPNGITLPVKVKHASKQGYLDQEKEQVNVENRGSNPYVFTVFSSLPIEIYAKGIKENTWLCIAT